MKEFTNNETFEIPSWNRTRGTSELRSFITSHEARLADYDLLDDIDA